jgi:hypothetical protein
VRPAIRRPINPRFWTSIELSGLPKTQLAASAGWTHYTDFYTTVRSERPRITPLTLLRLQRVAHAVGFPPEEIFLDEASTELSAS